MHASEAIVHQQIKLETKREKLPCKVSQSKTVNIQGEFCGLKVADVIFTVFHKQTSSLGIAAPLSHVPT